MFGRIRFVSLRNHRCRRHPLMHLRLGPGACTSISYCYHIIHLLVLTVRGEPLTHSYAFSREPLAHSREPLAHSRAFSRKSLLLPRDFSSFFTLCVCVYVLTTASAAPNTTTCLLLPRSSKCAWCPRWCACCSQFCRRFLFAWHSSCHPATGLPSSFHASSCVWGVSSRPSRRAWALGSAWSRRGSDDSQ